MPHLSPMKWTTMLYSLWMIILIIFTKIMYTNNNNIPQMSNNKKQCPHSWKWFQEYNKL